MPFLIAYIIIAISCSVISYRTLFSCLKINKTKRYLAFFALLISWFSPFIYYFMTNHIDNEIAIMIIDYIIYLLFPFVIILFFVHFIRDLFWFLLWGIKKIGVSVLYKLPHPSDENALKKVNQYSIIFTSLLIMFAFISANKMADIKNIEIYDKNINQELKLVSLADIHINRSVSDNYIEKLVAKVNNEKADFILYSGDVLDDKANKVTKKLDKLSQTKSTYGNYVVLGNHETYSGFSSSTSYFSKNDNFNLLLNSGKLFEKLNLYIGGITDYSSSILSRPDIKKSLKSSKNDTYKILLSHQPKVMGDNTVNAYDLVLSGHTHGGQIFPFQYPTQKGNLGYLAGLYEKDNTKIYVSRGVRYWGPKIRLLAPSEITVISLKPALTKK